MAGGYPCCCGAAGSTSSWLGSAGSSRASIFCPHCAGGSAPWQLQVVLAGVQPGSATFGCNNEEIWNATWVLQSPPGACTWLRHISGNNVIRCNPLSITVAISLDAGIYVVDCVCTATDSVFSGVTTRLAAARLSLETTEPPDCFTALDGLSFSGFSGDLSPLHYDFAAATALVSVL